MQLYLPARVFCHTLSDSSDDLSVLKGCFHVDNDFLKSIILEGYTSQNT